MGGRQQDQPARRAGRDPAPAARRSLPASEPPPPCQRSQSPSDGQQRVPELQHVRAAARQTGRAPADRSRPRGSRPPPAAGRTPTSDRRGRSSRAPAAPWGPTPVPGGQSAVFAWQPETVAGVRLAVRADAVVVVAWAWRSDRAPSARSQPGASRRRRRRSSGPPACQPQVRTFVLFLVRFSIAVLQLAVSRGDQSARPVRGGRAVRSR